MNKQSASPKVTHLLSNWRWTERSEPVTDLVIAEQQEGADSQLVCGKPSPKARRSTLWECRKKGLEPVTLEMEKHLRIMSATRDVPKLVNVMREHQTDVINCHMPNAHMLGVLANCMTGGKHLLVRTSYNANGPDDKWRSRFLLKNATDGLVVISEHARQQAVERFKFPASRIAVIEPGIDLERFNTSMDREQARARFGFGPDDFVIGMASRIQPRRRLDLLLNAAAELRKQIPNLKLFLVGHGDANNVVHAPAERLGISDLLVMPGYIEGDDLVAAYRAMDLLYFPVGGTDQSCRTLREVLACGCPVIGGNVGFIPELVKEGFNGLLVDLDVDQTRDSILALYRNPELRQRMARQAGEDAEKRFRLRHQARQNLALYQRLHAYKALPQPRKRVSKRALALLGFYAYLALSELELF